MKEIIKNAYALTKKHALLLIGAILSFFVLSMIIGFISASFQSVPVVYLISQIISVALRLFISVMLIKLVLSIVDGKEPEYSDIKPKLSEMMRFFSSSLLVFLIFLVVYMITIFLMGAVGVLNSNITAMLSDIYLNNQNINNYTSQEILYAFGVLFLLAIPAILLYLRLQFANYIVIDKENETAFTAVMRSANITKGYLFYIVLTVLAIILLNIIGTLLFFVGLLFTVPMSVIMFVLLYRSLEQNYEVDLLENTTNE